MNRNLYRVTYTAPSPTRTPGSSDQVVTSKIGTATSEEGAAARVGRLTYTCRVSLLHCNVGKVTVTE